MSTMKRFTVFKKVAFIHISNLFSYSESCHAFILITIYTKNKVICFQIESSATHIIIE